MKVGVFHPTIYWCGGAEIVSIAVINTLAKNGFEVVLFLNETVNQKKIKDLMGEKIESSVSVVIKHGLYEPRGSFHTYESAVRSLAFKLRTNCQILVDTYSCLVFPWADVCYIHFPVLWSFKTNFPYLRRPRVFEGINLPYAIFEKGLRQYSEKLILANSHYTAQATKECLGIMPEVLYPPVPSSLFDNSLSDINESSKEDLVAVVSRLVPDKRLESVPYVASLTGSNVKFVIAGLALGANEQIVVDGLNKMINKLGLTNRVQIATNLSRSELKALLRKAKVYLHTKEGEHFGISIAEAMARGCIPITPDSGGMKEFVPASYRYNSLSEAARKIEYSISNWSENEGRRMLSIAQKFSERRFSEQFIDIFQRHLAKNG